MTAKNPYIPMPVEISKVIDEVDTQRYQNIPFHFPE